MGVVLNFPRASSSAEPDDGIVSIIEGLLEQARNGDVQSIVIVTAEPDGHPACEMAMDKGHATSIVGALRAAEMQILKALEAVGESDTNN